MWWLESQFTKRDVIAATNNVGCDESLNYISQTENQLEGCRPGLNTGNIWRMCSATYYWLRHTQQCTFHCTPRKGRPCSNEMTENRFIITNPTPAYFVTKYLTIWQHSREFQEQTPILWTTFMSLVIKSFYFQDHPKFL